MILADGTCLKMNIYPYMCRTCTLYMHVVLVPVTLPVAYPGGGRGSQPGKGVAGVYLQ
jgi:hypothetical protein